MAESQIITKDISEFPEVATPADSDLLITSRGKITFSKLGEHCAATIYRALKLKVFSASGAATSSTAYLVAQQDADGLLNFSLLSETEYAKLK